MLDFDDARAKLLGAARAPSRTESLPLLHASGLILARPVISPINVPGFDNSAMDGYALAIEDFSALPHSYPVTQRIAAGQTGTVLGSGTAARIFTGAPVPPGSHAVVPQEHTELEDGRIRVTHPITAGQHIRLKGEDIAADSAVLAPGQRLGPQHLALAA